MANYDTKSGASDLNFQKHTPGGHTISRLVDFAKFTGTAAGAAGDTADVITLPAGFVVEDVYYKVIAASTTASSTFGAGTAADNVYFFASTQDATATAGTIVKTGAGASGDFHDIATVTTLANSLTSVVSTATTLRVLLGSTAPLNGKVQFVVRGFFIPAV